MEKIWLRQYPPGVPAEGRTDPHPSPVALLDESTLRQLTRHRFDILPGEDALSGALARLPERDRFGSSNLPGKPVGKVLRRMLRETV